jgi:hypothetical protein
MAPPMLYQSQQDQFATIELRFLWCFSDGAGGLQTRLADSLKQRT